MARRVDDIDADVFPDHRGGLGQDGDAALALEVVGIHGALDHALVLAISAGLLQQPVDQGGFAVVDVGDDGDVAKIHEFPRNQSAGPFLGPRREAIAAQYSQRRPISNRYLSAAGTGLSAL